ncbi:putative myristylated IMV envelope protein [Parapoxvirus red deer/HL953]|uniref:Putative myristylated IMV envelope protein n=1 Tax=Parapoxvirus red deer/HL953 TaxID=1579460 RepID=A0A0A7MA81_9POXV|nr:putative myristylated IMV envelope protein [Parapoxvirus red deer/HL953]AIZ77298.1 putative myristylated IMV envelope protein [Parapoxvirus red deer/HL953]
MGAAASIQTTVTTVSERIRNELEQTASASAKADCDVTIGSLIIRKNLGCSVSVRNMCSANSSAQLDAVMKAVSSTFNDLSAEQKAYVPGLMTAALNIQTTVTTAVKDFETYVKQTCNADSVIHNKIKVQNIVMDECASPPGGQTTHLEFVNTGTASGNCGVKAVMDVLAKASTTVKAEQEANKGFNTIVIAVVVAILAAVFAWYARHMFFMSTTDKIKLELAKKPVVHWTTYLDTFFTEFPPSD